MTGTGARASLPAANGLGQRWTVTFHETDAGPGTEPGPAGPGARTWRIDADPGLSAQAVYHSALLAQRNDPDAPAVRPLDFDITTAPARGHGG
ncbi:hypothetical protein [Streptomyces sp. NPDC001889]